MYNYSVVALGALYDTPVAVGNAALSGHLLLAAMGVLIGGLVVARTTRHGRWRRSRLSPSWPHFADCECRSRLVDADRW